MIEVRSRSVSRMQIASARRPVCASDPLRLQPRERRVPRDVNVSGEQRPDLPLVIRVEDIIEGQPAVIEIAVESHPRW